MILTAAQKKVLRIDARRRAIRMKGLKYKDLGIPALICDVVYERRKTAHIRRTIAKRLRIPMSHLWSDSFGIDG